MYDPSSTIERCTKLSPIIRNSSTLTKLMVKYYWKQNMIYCIVGNFERFNFRRCARSCCYKRAYFAGLIFAVHESTVKTTKIGPLKNFPLYSTYYVTKKQILWLLKLAPSFKFNLYNVLMMQIQINSMILICQEVHLFPLKRIPMKDGPQMSVLITRNTPFHLRGLVIDSLLTRNVENFHTMTGVMVNFPLEMNFLKGGPMTVFIRDSLLILILMKGATLLLLLMSFVGDILLDLHFCHSPLIGWNLMRGAIPLKWDPLGCHCLPSISQRLRLCLQKRYLIYRGGRNDQVM